MRQTNTKLMRIQSIQQSISLRVILFFFLIAEVEITNAVAQDFTDRTIGNMKYDLYNNTLKAVVKSHINDTGATGSLIIPSSVTYTDYQNETRTYSVTEIGSYAFDNCIGLDDTLVIPNTVTKIGDYAFYGCKNIKTIELGNGVSGVQRVGYKAFMGCDGLTSPAYNASVFVKMPTSYQGYYTLPEVRGVSNNAFNGCYHIDTLTIPQVFNSIQSYAFWRCRIKYLIFNSINCGIYGVDVYGTGTVVGRFFDETRLKKVKIDDRVETIPEGLFRGCKALTEVTIGKSVSTIGPSAFGDCTSLNSIYCRRVQAPTINNYGNYYNTFYNVPNACLLYVPCNWSGYTDGWRFQKVTYAVNEIYAYPNNPSWGNVEIIEEPHCDGFTSVVVIKAVPFSGYQFSRWFDGNTENPRSVTLTEDTIMYAIFEVGNGIEEFYDLVKVYAQGNRIVVEGADDEPVMVYDMVGRQIKDYSRELPVGIYLVKVGSLHARKVVIKP